MRVPLLHRPALPARQAQRGLPLADHRHRTGGVAVGRLDAQRRARGDDRLRGGPARPHPRLHAARRGLGLRGVHAGAIPPRRPACAPCRASRRRTPSCRGRRCWRAAPTSPACMLRGVRPDAGRRRSTSAATCAAAGSKTSRPATRCSATPAARRVELPGIILGTELARQLGVGRRRADQRRLARRRAHRRRHGAESAPLRRRRALRGRHARVRQRARLRRHARRAALLRPRRRRSAASRCAPPTSTHADAVKRAHRRRSSTSRTRCSPGAT